MEQDFASLNLVDGEEEPFEIHGTDSHFEDHHLCLVSVFLTANVVHFESMKNTMADLWHPLGGITTTEIGDKCFLFLFYNEIDLSRVLQGTPWFFNKHLLLLHKIQDGEDHALIPLVYSDFWVQVYDLPSGLMSEAIAKQFGNFIGRFLEYDPSQTFIGPSRIMGIKVTLDIRLPLKRKKKIVLRPDSFVYARFQYEKLSLFCFICGKLGHGESFCPVRLSIKPKDISFGWDISLKAPPCRGLQVASKWLVEPGVNRIVTPDKEGVGT
ncbi:hypothetical protein GQ457_07G004660 [Hibiscus cannabinus]